MGRVYRNRTPAMIHNQGRILTFESKNGKSIIDVTLSHRLSYTLENWRVLRSYNGTDHNTIHYSLKGMETVSYTHLTLPTTPYV